MPKTGVNLNSSMACRLVIMFSLVLAEVAVAQNRPANLKEADKKESATLALAGAPENTEDKQSTISAAELVRAVRESENWIHRIDTLFLRIESKCTRPPEAIAASRAELKKRFPDIDPAPQRFPNLRPAFTETLEYAFDRHKARYCRNDATWWKNLRIWDGKQLMAHTKHIPSGRENYYLHAKIEDKFHEFIACDTAWPRSQPHSFPWDTKDVRELMKQWGLPEDFILMGRSNYRGADCYVLDCDRSMTKDWSFRWYVGVDDCLLYGLKTFIRGKPSSEHWMCSYKEVTPGGWLPMTQGSELYELKADGEGYLRSRLDLKVLEVRVNEKLPDELFQIEFKDGVDVADLRFGGRVTYPYKADRTDEQWQEIGERARKRADSATGDNRARDALIGKPAPPFPENAEWLNSKPLTWEQLRGRVVILVFWAEWCGPCRRELPHMSDLHKKSKQSAISVIGIHTPGSKIEDIKAVMKKYDIHCPVYIDAPRPPDGKSFGAMSSRCGVIGIPYVFVVDKQGNVAGHAGRVEYIIALANELVKK